MPSAMARQSSVENCDEHPSSDRRFDCGTLNPKGENHEDLSCLCRMHVGICWCMRCCTDRQPDDLRLFFAESRALHYLQQRNHASKPECAAFRLTGKCAYWSQWFP